MINAQSMSERTSSLLKCDDTMTSDTCRMEAQEVRTLYPWIDSFDCSFGVVHAVGQPECEHVNNVGERQ